MIGSIVATATKKARADADAAERIVEILAAKYEHSTALAVVRPVRQKKTDQGLSARATEVVRRLGLRVRPLVLDDVSRAYLEEHARRVCAPKPKCTTCPLVSFCRTGERHLARLPKTLPVVVDLFGGAGGLGHGFRQANYRVGLAVEWDRDAAQSYRLNNPGVPVLEMDVGKVRAADVKRFIGRRPDVVCAGPPCQSYSLAGDRADVDPRHNLFKHVLSLSRALNPTMIVIENVTGVAREIQGRRFRDVIARAVGRRYDAEVLLLEAVNYGVPQTRRRYFFVGRPKGTPELGEPKHTHSPDGSSKKARTPTVMDALRGLPVRNSGSRNDIHICTDGTVIRNLSTMKHSKKVICKIKSVPMGGGPMSYRRLRKDFARTIVAGHRALPVHPTRNRTLNTREAAVIQGFPADYAFLGMMANTPLQVANAVPPPLAHALARHIRSRLEPSGKRR
jgi:DNA (cytosine-5)-methyltransferase 1